MFQYAVLVSLVFVCESGSVLSFYIYKRSIKNAFRTGLRNSLDQYGIEADRTAAVDLMQSKVTKTHFCLQLHLREFRY